LLFPVGALSLDSSPTYTFRPESAPNLDARTVAAAAFAAGSVSYLCTEELTLSTICSSFLTTTPPQKKEKEKEREYVMQFQV
jgi:hypothetical protein